MFKDEQNNAIRTDAPALKAYGKTTQVDEARIGVSGIGSNTLQRRRMSLHKRLAELEYKAQQVREALNDTEDPAVQKVMRILDLG